MTLVTEADVEQFALDWLAEIVWDTAHGADTSAGALGALRDGFGDVVLDAHLRAALSRLNPQLPAAALDDVFRKLTRPQGSTTEARNREFHRMLVRGVDVEYRDDDGRLRGEKLGLSDDELAFYDALETNDSAVQVLGDATLRDIARELVETVRRNVTFDWTLREDARARLRVLVRRLLRRYGYPPDKRNYTAIRKVAKPAVYTTKYPDVYAIRSEGNSHEPPQFVLPAAKPDENVYATQHGGGSADSTLPRQI